MKFLLPGKSYRALLLLSLFANVTAMTQQKTVSGTVRSAEDKKFFCRSIGTGKGLRDDLVIFGSPGLAYSFMELDLIDEYQLTLNPVLLGSGIPVYQHIKNKTNFKLAKATLLKSGVVGLHYAHFL